MDCCFCRQEKLGREDIKKTNTFQVISSTQTVPSSTLEENKKGEKNQDGTNMSDLPPELIFIILSKLSIKPLLRCRTLSKEWNEFTRNPEFLQHYHLSSSISQPCTFCYISSSDYEVGLTDLFLFGKSEEETIRIPFQQYLQGLSYDICCSCNGYLLLVPREKYKPKFEIIIYNPITKETMTDIPQRPEGDQSYLGFGYDSKTLTYKLVLQLNYILTLGETSWRKLPGPYREQQKYFYGSLFFNGAFYWIHSRGDIIVSLDICTEEYRIISHPLQGLPDKLKHNSFLVEYDNKLTFIMFDFVAQFLQTWSWVDDQKEGTWIHQTASDIADLFSCKQHKFWLDEPLGNDSLLLYHLPHDAHLDHDAYIDDYYQGYIEYHLEWFRSFIYMPKLGGQVLNFNTNCKEYYGDVRVLPFIPNPAPLLGGTSMKLCGGDSDLTLKRKSNLFEEGLVVYLGKKFRLLFNLCKNCAIRICTDFKAIFRVWAANHKNLGSGIKLKV